MHAVQNKQMTVNPVQYKIERSCTINSVHRGRVHRGQHSTGHEMSITTSWVCEVIEMLIT